MKLKKISPQADGFAHIMVIVSAVVVLAIIGTGTYVYHHENSDKAKPLASESRISTTPKLNTIAKTSATVIQPGTSIPASTSTSSTSTTPAQKVTTTTSPPAASTSTTTPTTTTTTSTTSSSPTPQPTAQTPLSALTAIITGLDNGTGFANVTSTSVTVPGPISNAQARPIVFTVNGQTYFAYTQGQEPNFNTTPAQTANSMAVVSATVSNPSLTQGHIDKTNLLVDENEEAVGYSTGGN
jgi:hypothetical protein